MATASYKGGGVGGKFRKRAFWRAPPATPYDRPPTGAISSRPALRRAAGEEEEGGNGWLAKLVDPASRIIASGASRLFSSVFRNRLPAPPGAPGENQQPRLEDPEVPCVEQSGCDLKEPMSNHEKDGAQQQSHSDAEGMVELEQLLNQKTFTKVEFDRLTELLRSRTIEPSTSQPAVRNEEEEKVKESEHADHKQRLTVGPSTSQPDVYSEKKGKALVMEQETVESFRLCEDVINPAVKLTIPDEEAASPTEIAKAYMDSRCSKVSPSTLSLRSQLFREEIASHAKRPFNVSVLPRSIVRFSGVPENTENGYMTPRPYGRSAMYKMSRSPYFKAQLTNIKSARPSKDSYAGPSTSSRTSTNSTQASGKQALKRGSQVLDNDIESFGPMRRIRQKSNLMSPPRNLHSPLPANQLATPSIPFGKDNFKVSMSSIQKPFCWDNVKDLKDVEKGDNKTHSGGILRTPPPSSEMGRKIIQQLDKLVPSPKSKPAEHRIIHRDESPSKLTPNMLGGRALKSMENIDSSKFLNMQDNSDFDASTHAHLQRSRSSMSQKQAAEENGPLMPAVSLVRVTSEALDMDKSVRFTMDAKVGMRSADFATSHVAAVPSQKRPLFQVTAPEDSLELDGSNRSTKETYAPSTSGNDKCQTTSECTAFIPQTALWEKSFASSSKVMLASNSVLKTKSETKASDQSVGKKNDGFLFPAAPASNASSLQTLMLAMPSPLLESIAQPKAEVSAPIFKSGFEEAESFSFSSTRTDASDAADQKIGVGNASTMTLLEGLNSDKGGDIRKVGDSVKSSVNAASSGSSILTGLEFVPFGASTAESLSNGLISSTASVSAAPVITSSSSLMTVSFTSAATTATFSRASISSTRPAISSAPSFHFGSGTLTGAIISVTSSMDTSGSAELDAKHDKALPFSVSSSATPTKSSVSLGIGGSCSASSTSSVFSRTGISTWGANSATLVASSLFSSTGNGSSVLSVFSASSNSGNCVSGCSTSSQSNAGLLFSSNSSQNLTLLASTSGSLFSAQMTQPRSGFSIFSGSPTQFGSFTSSPAFGVGGWLSSGSADSTYGSVIPAAKPFGSSSGFSFTTLAGSSSSSRNSTSSASSAPFGSSSGFGASSSSSSGGSTFSAMTARFGSSSGCSFSSGTGSSNSGCSTMFAAAAPLGASSGFSFSTGTASSAGSSISFMPSASATLFSFSSQPSTSSSFGSPTSSSTGSSFGLSAPSLGSSPFTFIASSGPTFSFTSAGTPTLTSSSTTQAVLALPKPAVAIGSGSPGNDQMNVEDSMADDTIQASAPAVPTAGRPTISPATPSFMFRSPAAPSGGPSVCQFGSQQNASIPQGPFLFQAAGNLELPAGGSFSLGSGGGDKSGRKFVKVRRDKHRKK